MNYSEVREANRALDTLEYLQKILLSNVKTAEGLSLKLTANGTLGTPQIVLNKEEGAAVLRAIYDVTEKTLERLDVSHG